MPWVRDVTLCKKNNTWSHFGTQHVISFAFFSTPHCSLTPSSKPKQRNIQFGPEVFGQ